MPALEAEPVDRRVAHSAGGLRRIEHDHALLQRPVARVVEQGIMVAADRHRPDAGVRQAAQLRGQCDAARHVPDPIVEDVAGNNPAKLKVLADVYGDGGEMQTAEIVIDNGTGDSAVQWTPGMAAVPQLMQVSVFDTTSAQLYVDEGNQIRFFPFGLALLHRRIVVCLDFKAKLEAERAAEVGGRVGLTSVTFQIQRDTEAQRFNKTLDKDTATLKSTVLPASNLPTKNAFKLSRLFFRGGRHVLSISARLLDGPVRLPESARRVDRHYRTRR